MHDPGNMCNDIGRLSEFDAFSGKFACLDVMVRTCFVRPTFLEKLFFGMHVRKLVKQFYENIKEQSF